MSFEVAEPTSTPSSPMRDLHRELCGPQGELCRSYSEWHPQPPRAVIPIVSESKVEQNGFWDNAINRAKYLGRLASDSAFAVGSMVSIPKEIKLPRYIAPFKKLGRAIGAKAAGAAVSLAGAGYRTYSAIKEDLEAGDKFLPRAQREAAASVAGIAAGGTVAIAGTAALGVVTLPAWATTAATVAIGAGALYALEYARSAMWNHLTPRLGLSE